LTMIELPALSVTWTLVLLVLTLLYIYGVWPHGFFKKLGIPGPRPWPFFGTLLSYTKGLCNFDMECAKKYGKVWGIYDGRLPILMVTDLEMIKVIMVKECYSNFINRRCYYGNSETKRTTGLAGPFADGIIMVQDERWKRMRSTLSPYFTSGRLKEIFPIAVTHADRFIKNMQKKDHEQPVKVKEVVGPYSLDVVTSSSFSVDIDSINNADDPFVTNVKKFIQFNMFNPLFLLILLFPSIAIILKKMGVTLFSKSAMDFFYSAVKKIKDEHNKESDGRVDFLQLMLQNQIPGDHFGDTDEQPAKGLTDHEILSQSFIFILGGYETTSTTLTFLLYNLATNPDCLEKLVEEIDTNFPPDTPITYDALMKMDYLEMAINESMRLLPTAPRLERSSKKTVEINGVTIPKDTLVGIPTYVLCRDPQLWESPDEFRPERFSPESKSVINQYAFLPFGLGPRNCIGMRFALMIMKILVVKLLQNFSVETCKETQIPLEMNAAFQPKVPITLKFIPRSHKAKQ
uniref:unspecific monooxygenase n=1 Tax=Cyprinus carpio TaxID=7962 RepID=A0A8C2IU22_CYPCA